MEGPNHGPMGPGLGPWAPGLGPGAAPGEGGWVLWGEGGVFLGSWARPKGPKALGPALRTLYIYIYIYIYICFSPLYISPIYFPYIFPLYSISYFSF